MTTHSIWKSVLYLHIYSGVSHVLRLLFLSLSEQVVVFVRDGPVKSRFVLDEEGGAL